MFVMLDMANNWKELENELIKTVNPAEAGIVAAMASSFLQAHLYQLPHFTHK